MGMTRQERIALHKKQERLQVKNDVPSVSDLKEGVPVLRTTSEGIVEYVRHNAVLYKKVMDRQDVNIEAVSSLDDDGYIHFPNGLMLQWGTTTDSDATPTITFPIAFPTSCFQVLASSGGSGGSTNIDTYDITTTNFVIRHGSGERPSYWFAIGY